MSTHAQLPPGGNGPAPVGGGYWMPAAPGGAPLGPAPVPPIAPSSRSTGFWIAVTAAVALGVVIALLAGFFIGRGTRLSNDAVQDKIVAQANADRADKVNALSEQRAAMTKSQKKVLNDARTSSYARGKRAGQAEGKASGQQSGYSTGYAAGQQAGYANGWNAGYSSGLDQGACMADSLYC